MLHRVVHEKVVQYHDSSGGLEHENIVTNDQFYLPNIMLPGRITSYTKKKKPSDINGLQSPRTSPPKRESTKATEIP